MKTPTKRKTALFLAAALNVSYAEERCFPPIKDIPTLPEVLECFQRGHDAQLRRIEKLAAENKKQQRQIAELKQENQRLKSSHLQFLDCGGTYTCTPRMCLEKCISLGLRMATYDEVYAWASAGKSYCAYMWMLNSQFPDKAYRGYPMYVQNPNGGCGRTNLKNIPRIEISGKNDFDWDSSVKADCACAKVN